MQDKKLVLIVEDDADIRLSMQLMFGREFEVVCCEDSISAMVAMRQQQPDALVLDLGLPGGDGLKVLQQMQDLPGVVGLPTIVVTGRDGDEVEEKAMELGASRLFRKPADPRELMAAVRAAVEADAAPQKRILVVEDDADTREAVAVRLRANGFVVSFAQDGATALVNARQLVPDLILLDLGLPCGDGFKVLERLRAMEGLADIPVVVLSGKEPSEVCVPATAAGADFCLQKPASDIELLDAVRAVL